MLANYITLSRFPLLLANVLMLYFGSPALRLAGVALLLVGLGLDTVDGMVARKSGQTTMFGSVLDIAADRTYELVLWAVFADLGLISVVMRGSCRQRPPRRGGQSCRSMRWGPGPANEAKVPCRGPALRARMARLARERR